MPAVGSVRELRKLVPIVLGRVWLTWRCDFIAQCRPLDFPKDSIRPTLLPVCAKQFVELLQLLRQCSRRALQCVLKRLLGRIGFVEIQQRLCALVL
jgi:hypothetical protein